MGNTFYFEWEVSLMEFLQSIMGSVGVALASFFTMFGEELFLVGIVAFLYWSFNKKVGERIAVNLFMSILWFPMIKNVALRRRPYFDNPNIKCLKAVDPDADIYDIDAQGFSFPSGHSLTSCVTYTSLAVYFKPLWIKIVGIALPLFVAVSRFCLGVHYPTDVIVGLAMGYIIVLVTPVLYDKFFDKDWFLILVLLTGVPGIFFCNTSDFFSGFGITLGGVFGIIFERHFVNFKDTRKPLYMILRFIFGIGVFLLFAQGLKFILPANYLTRVIRYALGAFIAMGVYPLAFKKFEKEDKKE